MDRLSDIKLQFLKTDYSGCLWYITKQNCSFRDLMMMASILEMWNDDPNESFESFFDRKKTDPIYTNYIGNSPHRALKNCEFYGIMVPSAPKSKAAYSSKNLTDVYYHIKSISEGNYVNTEKYQEIINKQLETMEISVNGNGINPIMYTLKVLLLLGDATGEYQMSTQEFKLFVCTSDNWNQYYLAVESILRFRTDSDYKTSALEHYDIANDTRFNMVLKNLSYVESDTKTISIITDEIPSVRKKVAEFEIGTEIKSTNKEQWISLNKQRGNNNEKPNYIAAIRTKPFLLLAGISGTGKSRIVRELAFKSCPEYLQDKDGTTPGNYCMIEVKPNWHDSTELLGYYSNMNKSYQFKKFVKFLVKAKMFPNVPFFVCLDEMNLAPVEHYFAEMLSIMETRKHPKIEGTDEVNKDVIKTGTIVDAQHFREFAGLTDKNGNTYAMLKTDRDIYMKLNGIDTENDIDPEIGKRTDLTTEGLTLPDNVIIIGTVNMDDTTHQFSRKVIDRAMTIEMNGGKLSNMFGGRQDLEYLPKEEQEKWQNSFRQLYVNADEVLETHPDDANTIIEKLPAKLEEINKALKGTPFEVSYRVLNELTIMVGVLLDCKKEDENIDDIINQALDHILLMKILPRIEGDSDMFNLSKDFKDEYQKKYDVKLEYNNRLEWLMDLAPEIENEEQEGGDHRQTAREKIQEMIERLNNQEFTRFWP